MGQLTFNLQPERRIYTVSDLTARIRDLLMKNLVDISVHGEISNCREAQSGHFYFTLKDDRAQVKCVLFKNQQRGMKCRPEDGIQVTVRGSISVYEARGEYQIYVESMDPVGRGALQLAFEQLKKRLEAEGLFDSSRKKPLPLLPSRIGLITSPTGAAVRDVVRILTRRFPNVHLTLYPVRVQGPGAAEGIIEALHCFHKKITVDAILLVRGGGSLEDLWEFNEEIVARAIAKSQVPVICGVGHETDFTIADFVADVRASTPSAAAEIVVQTRREFDKHVRDLRGALESLLRYRLMELSRKVHELGTRRGFRKPLDLLRQRRQQVDDLNSRLAIRLRGRLDISRRRLGAAHLRIARFDLKAKIIALHRRLQNLDTRRATGLRGRLEGARRRLAAAHLRLARFDFRAKISKLRLSLHACQMDLALRIDRALRVKRERLERLTVLLEERSPMRVLERGYAIATDATGNVIRDVEQVRVGDAATIHLRRGRLITEVKDKEV